MSLVVNLKSRSTQLEIMDDLACEGRVVDQTLRELYTINTYLGGNRITLNAFHALIKKNPQDSYSLVDLGCGGGDTLKLISNWGDQKGIKTELTGLDANPYITEYVKNNCVLYSNITPLTANVFDESFKSQKYDVVHASLFLHHFTDNEIVQLLKQLHDQANLGIIINDLHRHWISYFFTKYLITRWSKSEMVKIDSVVSVARSFTRKELKRYFKEAGIENYTLKWKWAFRWEVIIVKNEK